MSAAAVAAARRSDARVGVGGVSPLTELAVADALLLPRARLVTGSSGVFPRDAPGLRPRGVVEDVGVIPVRR